MRRYRIAIGEKVFDVEIVAVQGDTARVLVNGRPYEAKVSPPPGAPAAPSRAQPAPPPPRPPAPPLAPAAPPAATAAGAGAVTAPMPGAILEVLVRVGDRLQAGDTVVKLEAMKMENDVKAQTAGTVSEVRVSKGANVAKDEVLLVISVS